jgi:hypothetical protein
MKFSYLVFVYFIMPIATEKESLGIYVLSLLDKEQSREQIETHLLEKGHDEKFVKELVAESIKLRYAKRRAQGMGLILAGAVICFTSFLLTITASFTHTSFPYVLYGLTTIGIIVVFAGLMKVF